MHRFLPLLFLLTACSGDPLELHITEVDRAIASDGLIVVDLKDGPLAATTELLRKHKDLNLKLSFRATEGSAAKLMLQGKYPVELPSLMVAGGKPRIQPAASSGIWQDLEVVFIAPEGDVPAILSAVYLNGTLVYYQQELSPSDVPAGPLTLIVESGDVEVVDLRYSDQGGTSSTVDTNGVNLNLPLLRYEYYDLPKGTVDVTNWASLTPDKVGYINRFDLNAIREKEIDYAIRFYGKLNIPSSGEYQLSTYSPASVRVFVDGQRVVNDGGAHGAHQIDGFIDLSEGRHDFQLDYVQNTGWNRLDVKYLPEGEEALKYLNSMEEGKTIGGLGASTPQKLETDDYPYLLRSFLYFPAPKVYEIATKRTHVISVGEGEGPHYSLDLQNGALLQMWRGDFADTHDMWAGRGEPQVMRPLGPTISFDGTPQWTDISGDSDEWPAAAAESTGFHHVRHSLDEANRPTFEYEMKGGHSLTDKLTPVNGGLVRELVHGAGDATTIYTQIAAARQITETAPGEYELRGPGVKIKIESYDGDRLVLQRSEGINRLIAELPTKGHITYRIDW
jgi:hypothetical protein